jgi:predicted dehydrogenase
MLRIGIIGCGRIADQHAIEIQNIPGCEITCVCDREILLAQQFSERYRVKRFFINSDEMLKSADLDVIHITTPPQSHYALGKSCIDAGYHVFIEKPLAVNSNEVNSLLDMAISRNVKLTVGHNAQFSHAAMKLRKLVKAGFLGGKPVHLESNWCYSFTDPGYAKAILGDKNHWIRSLPGKYLHDIISHGICRLAEYLDGDNPTVLVNGHVSPLLKSIGEHDIIDELRVIIDDNKNTTAFFSFSSQINPPVKQFTVYGPKSYIIIDHNHQTVITSSNSYKYYLNHFVPPLNYATQYLKNSIRNVKNFVKRNHYFEIGRRNLIYNFYQSIVENSELPIPYREIRLTYKIMDLIFNGLKTGPMKQEKA